MRVLPCRAPSGVYHSHDSWVLSNFFVARGFPANLFCYVNLAFGQCDTPAHRIFIFPLHAIVQFYTAARSFWFVMYPWRIFNCLVLAAGPVPRYCLAPVSQALGIS